MGRCEKFKKIVECLRRRAVIADQNKDAYSLTNYYPTLMEKIIGIYEQFDKKYDSFVAHVKIYLEPRAVMLLRWIPCVLIYAYFYISEIYKKQFVKLCLMMTSAFFIFVQHILGA